MPRAVGYARLSLTKHGDNISIERQTAAILDYAHAHKLPLDPDRDLFVEQAGHRSGADETRPAYNRLLSATQRGDVSHVIVFDLSRFARSDSLVPLLLDFNRRGIQFVSLNDPIDVSNSQGKFSARLKSAFQIMYRDDISDRNTRAFADIKRRGGKVGSAPQGLQSNGKRGVDRGWVVRGETYAVDGHTRTYLDTVKKYFEIFTQPQPRSMRQCAVWLNEHGYRWRSKRGECVKVSIERLDDCLPESYRGFLPDKLIDAFIERKKQRAQEHRPVTPRPSFVPPLLYRLVTCQVCGALFQSHNAKCKFPFYAHYDGMCSANHEYRTYKIDTQALEYLAPLLRFSDDDKKRIAKRAVESANGAESTDERAAMEAQLERLDVKCAEAFIADDERLTKVYQSKRQEIIERLSKMKPEPPRRAPLSESDVIASLDNAIALLSDEHGDAWARNSAVKSLIERVEVDAQGKAHIILRGDVAAWLNVGS